MKGLRRIAFLGAAALAGMMGLSGLQSRAMARANVESARQTARAGLPTPDKQPISIRQSPRIREYRLNRGGERRQTPYDAIWIGFMRPAGYRLGGTWRVGNRGRSRLGGRS